MKSDRDRITALEAELLAVKSQIWTLRIQLALGLLMTIGAIIDLGGRVEGWW